MYSQYNPCRISIDNLYITPKLLEALGCLSVALACSAHDENVPGGYIRIIYRDYIGVIKGYMGVT